MRHWLPLLFCLLGLGARAQVNTNMPPEANLFSRKAMEAIKPEVKNMVTRWALQFREKDMNTSDLLLRLKKEPLLHSLNRHDIAGVAVLVLVKVSGNADEELKKKVRLYKKNPGEAAINEAKELTDYKSLLARNVEQIIIANTVSTESVVSHLQ